MTKVLVNFIQDRSGSMQSNWTETLSGYRAFVKEICDKNQQDGVEYLFSLTTFDTVVDTPIVAQPIKDVNLDELAKHGPRGWTALYDAVGRTVRNTDENHHGADKIIVVIVTDGEENSSYEWNKDRLHTLVDSKLREGNWTFTYLGTQPETWHNAKAIGMGRSVHGFDVMKSEDMYAMMAQGVTRLASSPHLSSPDLVTEYMSKEEAQSAGITNQDDSAPPKPAPVSQEKKRSLKELIRTWRNG